MKPRASVAGSHRPSDQGRDLHGCLISARGIRLYETSEGIADIALFLASDAALNLVGAVLLANGGRFTT
jgi:NAD(P)-dependent dehydrogenase (short-subunit alcohol dehydrogenase family)